MDIKSGVDDNKKRGLISRLCEKTASLIGKHPFLSVFISSLLSALPHTFSFLWWLSWFSMVPFVIIVFLTLCSDGESAIRRKPMRTGFTFAFFYHFFNYYWFLWLYPFESVGFDKMTAAAVTALAWIGSSTIHGVLYGISVPLFGLLSRPVRKAEEKCVNNGKSPVFHMIVYAFLFSGTWLLCEELTQIGTLAFPWSRICITQYSSLEIIQSASLFGPFFISFIIVFINAMLAVSIIFAAKHRRQIETEQERKKLCFSSLLPLTLAALIFSVNFVYGALRLTCYENGSEKSVKATLVQGNLLSGEKWVEGASKRALEKYTALTLDAAETYEPDIIIWPESAVPLAVTANSQILQTYKELSEATGATFFTGSFYYDGGADRNAVLEVEPEGIMGVYSKHHLVPFGEYLPWGEFFDTFLPALGEINQYSNELVAGTDSGNLIFDGRKIGALICFDSIFPSIARSSAADGAELILLVTNDSWYKDSPALYQHLAQAVFRAVENGRYVLRAANSGVSALITDKGEIIDSIPPLTPGTINEEAELITRTTLYTRIGDVFLYTVLALSLVIPIIYQVFNIVKTRNEKK